MAQEEGAGLTLPPRAKSGKESFDIRSRKLSAWIENLPAGNIGETTRLLYQALHDVNRHQHGWKERYRFLEAIRSPLHMVQQAISRRYTGQGFPLPAKTQQIAALSQQLSIEMALGYKAACEEMLQSFVLFQDRGALRTMLHRTVRYLSQSILTAYQIYSQQPRGAWHELHRLHAFAEKRDLHQDPVVDRLFEGLPESSIARIYKQIVLLSAASPFGLRQGEALVAYQALARWSAHARLLPYNDPTAASALFVVHTNSDDEPDYRAFDKRPCTTDSCLVIDTRQLLQILQDESNYTANTPTTLLTPDLIMRLIHAWGSVPKRGEGRMEGGQSMSVVVGMTRIHQQLAPVLHDAAMAPHLSLFESHATHSEERQSSANDIWNIYSTKNRVATKQHPNAAKKQAEDAPATDETQRWKVRNESPGGYRFTVPENQGPGVRVGEILAIHGDAVMDQWQPAVVRWLRRISQSGIEAGIQVIAPQMIVIMVKNLTPGKDKGEQQRGLLLPANQELGQNTTLILPNRIFLPGERVLLHTPHHEIKVVLGNALQDSGIFVQFEFDTVEKDKLPVSGQGQPEAGGLHFENLWEQL